MVACHGGRITFTVRKNSTQKMVVFTVFQPQIRYNSLVELFSCKESVDIILLKRSTRSWSSDDL